MGVQLEIINRYFWKVFNMKIKIKNKKEKKECREIKIIQGMKEIVIIYIVCMYVCCVYIYIEIIRDIKENIV